MKFPFPEKLEVGRILYGPYRSMHGEPFGQFLIQGPCGERLGIIACHGEPAEAEGWEHVSVSTRRRVPNWQEMCFVKDLFWDAEECVVQFHPPKSDYVNNHLYVLHLWRQKAGFPRPPAILVGFKERGVLTKEEAAQLRKELGWVDLNENSTKD